MSQPIQHPLPFPHDPGSAIPTQVKYPGRAVARTIVATLVTAIAVLNTLLPVVADTLHKSFPGTAFIWINTIAVAVAAISGIITRIMAVPQVDQLLKSIGLSAIK